MPYDPAWGYGYEDKIFVDFYLANASNENLRVQFFSENELVLDETLEGDSNEHIFKWLPDKETYTLKYSIGNAPLECVEQNININNRNHFYLLLNSKNNFMLNRANSRTSIN